MYGPGPVPFNDGCAVPSMDLSTEYEVILLTSKGRKVRCKSGAIGSQYRNTVLMQGLKSPTYRERFYGPTEVVP
jgi:hypothetical protein